MTATAITAAATPGAFRIHGADAASFLQGQLTQDVRGLADGGTRLAALQTAQGRVIAVLHLARRGDEFTALLPASRVDAVITHLRRYTLRARVALTDLGASHAPVGVLGVDAGAPGGTGDAAAGGGERYGIGGGRWVLLGPRAGDLAAVAAAPAAAWTLAGIRTGLPELGAETAEAFTAHMLNLDRLGAISFTKGCYTGQEIVARTEHQGRVKRRLLRYALGAGAPPAPLAALHARGNKVGEVVIAAADDTGAECLAVVSLDAQGAELSTDDGRLLQPLPLPYALA